jgi:Domain of unknown function (DUF4438), N-terminal/Domain of unknown function (DUF4438), C-terminal
VFDNRSQIVGVAVQGQVSSPELPTLPASPYVIGADGRPRLLVPPGGIVYNVRVGDSAFGWAADMVQPGVSVKSPADGPNHALNVIACVGNEAIVAGGDALGARGTVIGKSGRFADHVIVHFAPDVLERLAIQDKVLIRALGRSLALSDYPDVQLKSCSPALLDALEVRGDEPGVLTVPVAAEVSPQLAGAGAGLGAESGAIQIQTEDEAALREAGLDGLRLGDIVALRDFDTRWGPGYLAGALTIGVVAHGDSPRGGHGPGVTPLMTAAAGRLKPELRSERNLADLLGLRAAQEAAA